MSTLNVTTVIPSEGTNTDLSLDGKGTGNVAVVDDATVGGTLVVTGASTLAALTMTGDHLVTGNIGINASDFSQVNGLSILGNAVPMRVATSTSATMYIQLGASGTSSYPQVTVTGDDMTFRTGYVDRMTIDSGGDINVISDLSIGATFGPSFPLDLRGGGATAAQAMRVADASPTEYFGIFNCNTGGNTPNAANAALKVRGMLTSNRAINAGGSVNASGADYAEYMTKADGCNTIEKGSVCGVNSDGKLTDVFADAHSFVIKSTDPSYVGGDIWGIKSTDSDGTEVMFEGDKYELDDDGNETLLQDAELEAERQKVDRIAFSGQVPCTITGAAAVGDYVIPQAQDAGIEAIAVSSPTFEQYKMAVGKVWKLGEIKHIVAVKIG